MPAQDLPDVPIEIGFGGKLVTSMDPSLIGPENFSVLKNFRYDNGTITGIAGMSKINTNATTNKLATEMFHYKKDAPTAETHVLVQSFNAGRTEYSIYDNKTAIGSDGDFESTAVMTVTGTGVGKFSNGPGGTVLFSDGSKSYIWGGDESYPGCVVVYDQSASVMRDITNDVCNNDTGSFVSFGGNEYTTINGASHLLMHFDNNLNDTNSIATASGTDITYSTTAGEKFVGSHSAVFNGTTSNVAISGMHIEKTITGTYSDLTIDFWNAQEAALSDDGEFIDTYDSDTETLMIFTGAVKSATFNSGGVYQILVGDVIRGNVSGALGHVYKVTTSGGTWAGADATGTIWYVLKSGTFQNGETVDVGTSATPDSLSSDGLTFTSGPTTVGDNKLKFEVRKVQTVTTPPATGGQTTRYLTVSYIDGISGAIAVTLTGSKARSFGTSTDNMAFVLDGTTAYMFIGGFLIDSDTMSIAAQTFSPLFTNATLGQELTTFYEGTIDELAIFPTANNISDYSVAATEYTSSEASNSHSVHMYYLFTRPINAVKLYVSTGYENTKNASACFPTIYYYDGMNWSSLGANTDGTATGAYGSLRQTGTITFNDTETSARQTMFNGMVGYWYRITFTEVTDGTRVYKVTVGAKMQEIKDVWDQEPRVIFNCMYYDNPGASYIYNDFLLNVALSDFDASEATTYLDISSLDKDNNHLVLGFSEKSMGFNISIPPGYGNTTASTLSVYYWDGNAWTAVEGLVDMTKGTGTASMQQSGAIYFDAPDHPNCILATPEVTNEYPSEVGNSIPLYNYKLVWDTSLANNVRISHITGIPAPKDLPAYGVATMWQDRVWLFDEVNFRRNIGVCSAGGTNCVFNGTDSIEIEFGGGEAIVTAEPIFSKYNAGVFENLVVLKRNETYMVDGYSTDEYKRYLISDNYGCIAKNTIDTVDVEFAQQPWFNRQGAIWLSASGVVLFDTNAITLIDGDIDSDFTDGSSTEILSSIASRSYGYYDMTRSEYHLIYPSGSSAVANNKEMVYDVSGKRWFEIDRGSTLVTQCACVAKAPDGTIYTLGMNNLGFLYQLEDGGLFDTTAITYTVTFGDILPMQQSYQISRLRRVAVTCIARALGSNITVTHSGDTDTATTLTSATRTISALYSTKRIVKGHVSVDELNFMYHKIGLSYTLGSGEAFGFTPLRLGMIFKPVRKDII